MGIITFWGYGVFFIFGNFSLGILKFLKIRHCEGAKRPKQSRNFGRNFRMLYNEILGSSRGMTQSGQGGDFYRDCFASLAMTEFRNDGISEFPN